MFKYFTTTTITTLSLFLILFWNVALQSTGTMEVNYTQTDAVFPNPERGFYTWTQGEPGSSTLNPESLRSNRDENRSLIIRLYYIGEFRDADFTDDFLDQIRGDFQALREAGMKAILKFRYSTAIGEPDAPLERVLGHLDQLEPVFEEYYDVISVAQGGFIGAWGEWHSSTNNLTSPENMRAILSRFMDVLPPERHIQVRNPNHKMNIYQTNQPFPSEKGLDGSNIARTGHHNDCFLASPTDVGTYHLSNYTNYDMEEQLTIEWIKGSYLHPETRYVPMGGETCNPRDDAGDRYHCETALKELAQMHWSYLNQNYSREILDTWEEQGCMPEIERRLGYRFALQSGSFSEEIRPGGTLSFNLELKNDGFAAPYNPRGVQVLLRNFDDPEDIWEVNLPEDPRLWFAGRTVNLSYEFGIPEELNGYYEVLFNLPDPAEPLRFQPEFSIRTANDHIWEEETGFNHLDHVVIIDPSGDGKEYSGELEFKPFGTWDGTIEPVSSEPKNNTDLPSAFRLHQNFPNPFNPSTTISFDLETSSYVKLEVFNLIGERIAMPVDAYRQAGTHAVKFDMEGLASGTYIYVLTTQHGQLSRSMSLIK